MKMNWLLFGVMMLVLLSGFFAGMTIGIKVGQMIIFEGANLMFKDSNINITIDVNETTLVNEVNKTIVPYLKEGMMEKE
ncbi:hypothetical protein LCGC14_0970150 [marine sediment metagenome]|uniref:Uncharacterized protein n=1 Tax=marine sediment metagenome TaxID=412755 RepID=A0A0F9NY18_9ZZZZ